MLYTGFCGYNAWSIQIGTWGALSEKRLSVDAMQELFVGVKLVDLTRKRPI